MKTLLLLRHAKSCWEDESLSDHDRPLKRRGVNASARMGKLIRKERLTPDLIICSTAVRAKETLQLAMKEFKARPPVEYTLDLYHCSPEIFVSTLATIEHVADCVMLIGHNPGLEEFLSHLIDQNELMPTAALAQVELDVSDWSDFDALSKGKLIHIWRPKELVD